MQAGCKKEDEGKAQRDKEHTEIEQYAAANNLDGTFTASGLYYKIIESGSESHPNIYSQVTVKYKGYFLSGEVFDEQEVVTFNLINLIEGWKEGVPLIGSGGKIMLIIPSHLAYGDNRVRAFDITLYNFSQ